MQIDYFADLLYNLVRNKRETGGYGMISQRLIAQKAGVSYATVSRALTHSARVSPETMQRIRRAMDELGIEHIEDMFLGRNASSSLVLVVVGDISKEFYANIIIGLSSVLSRHRYNIVLCNSNYDAAVEMEAIQRAQEERYAGIVMITVTESRELVAFLQNTDIPVILVNRYIRSLDLDVVRIDNYRGGYLAAQHLIENGHRRIAHLAGPRNSATAEDRLRGFRHAMIDSDLPMEDSWVIFGDLSRECGKSFAAFLAEKDFTAAYIGNDYMAAGAVHQLLKLGRRIPEDISIICFDDSPLVNEDGLNITCLSCDPTMMGCSTAEILLGRIAEPLGRCVKTIYSPTLIRRQSVKRLT